MKIYKVIMWDLKDKAVSYGELAELPEFIALEDNQGLREHTLKCYGYEPAEVEEIETTPELETLLIALSGYSWTVHEDVTLETPTHKYTYNAGVMARAEFNA